MRASFVSAGLAASLLVCILISFPSPALSATTELITVGLTQDDIYLGPAISADGRFVAFSSSFSGIVPDDTNATRDVFVRDRLLGITQRVSVSSAGQQGNGASSYPAISADGRFVAFSSWASNLVAGDTNGTDDVFLRDRARGTTERVSVSTTGQQADGSAWGPVAISADGRFVAFTSAASNLVAGDTNRKNDVFVRDRLLGVTERVSLGSSGQQGSMGSFCISGAISADGRFVAFESFSPGFGGGAWSERAQVFLRDRLLGTTEVIGLSSAGELPDEPRANCFGATISSDGRFVAFTSLASNLVPGDTNGAFDVFVRDRFLRTTERVSISSDGEQADEGAFSAAVSGSGRLVVFESDASNLVADDTNGAHDVFVHDRMLGTTERVSVGASGEQANGESSMSESPAINTDGRFVVFTSAASNLVPGDTNDARDVFLRDRGPQHLFPDVPDDYWAFAEIVACIRAGIISGYPDGLYRPNSPVTRDQMAVFISRALVGGDENVPPGPRSPSFLDVPRYHWAYDYIEYAKARGIVEGYGDAFFLPDLTINRAQMAVFIARAIADPTGEEGLADYQPPDSPTFTDIPTDYWCYKHIEYLAENQVVAGYPDGGYHPTETVTRDQMAVFIARAFEL